MSLEDEILVRIRPTAEETARIDAVAKHLVDFVRSYMDEHGIDAELKLVGSYSKGTYLANPDLDLFIMFPPETPHKELVDVGLKIGEDVLHGTRMYAEHPYTSAVFEGVDVDLVPNIHIKDTSHLETAVDRTPFHTEYLLSHMKEGQADQIRLLKKFMKGVGTYGAEPNVRGFSGYLCEILVLKYGSFRKVLEAAAEEWHPGIQIELEKTHVRLTAPIVFYDPVDGKRNVASAVHEDTFNRFIAASKAYLAHPDERFFFPRPRQPLPESEILSRTGSGLFRLLAISLGKPDTADDNIYAQVWKSQYALENKFRRFGFEVFRAVHGVSDGRVTLLFMLAHDTLTDSMLREGPSADGKNAQAFLDKWNEAGIVRPFIRDGKWYAVVPRQYTSAEDMVRKEIAQAGVGKNVPLDSLKVLDHDTAVKECDRLLLSELLDPREAWEN